MSTGKPIAHDSAHGHVTGMARYIDDMPTQVGQLHVAIGGATIACGVIQSIDLTAVRNAAGVVDVITFKDLPALTDIGPVFPGDTLLVDKNIEFLGQAVFAVAAHSMRQAQQALMLANIVYEETAPLLDLQKAIDEKIYVRPPHTMQRGNAKTAIASAAHTLSGTIEVGGQEHFYLEGQVAKAVPQDDGGVCVYSSNQNPTETQHLVAGVLGIPMNQVTLVTRRMGGAFGGKETQAAAVAAFAALFAVRQQVAVSCRLSRRDDMSMTGKRHPFINRYNVGFDERGKILGIEHTLAAQCGNSPDLSDAIVDRAMFHSDNAYYLNDVHIDGLRCKSNTVSNTAFRGFGGPQGIMAIETVIDHIACELNKDPLIIRQLNFYGDAPRNVTPYHQTIEAFNLPEIFKQLKASSNYAHRRTAIREFNASSAVLRKGIAITPVKFGISFTVNHLNQGGALLHLYNDGSVQLNHGGTEMGQGLMMKVAQVVSATLGMDIGRIAITATRTDKVPNTSATAASSGSDINGMAAQDAALTIKQRLIDYLIDTHQVTISEIKFENDQVVVDGRDTQKTYTWEALAKAAYMARVQLSATGFYKTPKIFYDRKAAKGRPFLYYANGAAVSEVIIDTLTGEYKLLRCDILHDVGNSINPAIDIGQIEGGYIQGLGWLTTEELKWNDAGRLLTDGPATYKIPAISDTPIEFNVSLLQNAPNEEATVFRSKAVGEPPFMLAISAFSAIRDAIGALADYNVFPQLNSPATPEEILRVCDEVKQLNAGETS